ncbi:MAG: phosphoribosylanthranilate isomerase, partial [Halioglobus sp.]
VVALFVDEPADGIARTLAEVPVDVLQFHGDEPAEFCQRFDRPWIKAVRVREGMDPVAACRPYYAARGILLDTWQEGVPGGTGETFDWRRTDAELPLPGVVAGGLNAGNVGEAMRVLRPAGVDVSGGVESTPGIKDSVRIREFIAAVRAADQQLDGP